MEFFYKYLPASVPTLYFFLSVGIFFIASNVSVTQRVLLLPLLLTPVYLSLQKADSWPGDLGSLWSLLLFVWLTHSTSLFFLEKNNVWVEAGNSADNCGTIIRYVPKKYHAPLRLWNNPRLIGTTRQARLKYQQSKYEAHGLLSFTSIRLAKLITYVWLNTYGCTLVFSSLVGSIQLEDFDLVHRSFFRRLLRLSPLSAPITEHEVRMRAVFVSLWVIAVVTKLDAAHTVLSLIAVTIIRLDQPCEWPPLFGSFYDVWNIRRFWGTFWHQISLRAYQNYAQVFVRNVCFLRPGSWEEKVGKIFVIFLLSGVIHAMSSWGLGDRCSWPLDIWWFCTNFIGGGLEAAVEKALRLFANCLGKDDLYKFLIRSVWIKLLGFLWVYLFLFWSIPKWQYAKMHCILQGIVT